MIEHTVVSRLEGSLVLCASLETRELDPELNEVINKAKLVQRRLNRNSEPQGSIESDLAFLCICNRAYPRKLAFTYLSDLQTEFENNYKPDSYSSPTLRPYALNGFDKYIQQTKETYQDTRATQNLDKLNSELKDVTKVMTKNIEDLLYRGDSLERMGDMSSRLREDSRKYRKAAVRINWELLLKQYGPFGALGLFIIIFIWWRFF
ncbi:SNAP receptor [Kalmusia sp. IMI 367209]|nr:SNAP receptor [Kalmusia sp. IMI 367209]